MTKHAFVVLMLVIAAGCSSTRATQMMGTQLSQADGDRQKLVTYVTPEEFDKMTPEERQRLHAEVGVSVSVPIGGGKAPSKPISEEDLRKAVRNSDR
jgi:hypothetical protein